MKALPKLNPELVLIFGRSVAFAGTFLMPVILARVFEPGVFGAYKQLFLILGTTCLMAQMGMAQSLYYFLPLSPRDAGSYAFNAVVSLLGAGLVCSILLIISGPSISQWLSNPEIAGYIPAIAILLILTCMTSPLEIIAVSAGRYGFAAMVYGGFEVLRATLLVAAALWSGDLTWLLRGAIAAGLIRAAATLGFLITTYGTAFKLDLTLLKRQLGYALPFALAVVIEIIQANFHYYAVAYYFDPAVFAIYAVGCMQIPIVEIVAAPAGDVLMVRMAELRREQRTSGLIDIWKETTLKLATVFLPLVVLLLALGRELIFTLFTETYAASVPIFLISSTSIALAVFQTDAVLRVFAQTRFIFGLNVMRMGVVVCGIGWFIGAFHLAGAITVSLLAGWAAKIIGIMRLRTLMQAPLHELLPWRRLGKTVAAAIGAALPVLVMKAVWSLEPVLVLLCGGLLYAGTYGVLLGSNRRRFLEELCAASQAR